MSDFRFRRLEEYRTGGTDDHMELSLSPPRSPTGKIHRLCPEPTCVPKLFQLGDLPDEQTISETKSILIRRLPKTSGITCPYCGHDDKDQEFIYPGDIDAAKEQVAWAAKEDISDMLSEAFRGLDFRSSGGMFSIQIKTEHTRSYEPEPYVWREDLLRDLTCDICGRRYGVYAIGLFCPDCGGRNIHVHFAREIELISQQVEEAVKVKAEGKAELAYRLLGNAHEDVLTALETYLKTIFRFLVKTRLPEQAKMLSAKKMIANKFQNVEKGRGLYAKIGIDPYQALGEADLQFLKLNIEKRHVVGHNLSMADEAYIEVGQGEQLGQTVTLLANEITRFASICGLVIVGLEEQCPEFKPSKPVITD